MKLTIGKKELNIKFGYKPTAQSRILSQLARLENTLKSNNEIETLEDLLLFLPELLLIGLQRNHEEYRYNIDTGEGKEKQLDEAFALMEEYFEGEDADIMELFQELEKEMLENGFLKKLFQQEQKKLKEKSEKVEKKEN